MVKNNDLKIDQKILIGYYKNLIGSFYKLLPLYENLDVKTKLPIGNPEIAFEQFQKYLSNLLVEVYGNCGLFFHSTHSVQIVNILRGVLLEIKINEHAKLKSLVFQCISLCNKIIKELESDL